ncbi:MAG: hypothetical protein AAFO94_16005, partial [Bacteroidota bacterium]
LFSLPPVVWFALGGFRQMKGGLKYRAPVRGSARKIIEMSLPWKQGQEVSIKGERAEVEVEAWDKDQISVVFEFIAKNPDKQTAETDLEALKYVAEEQGNRIFLRNYIFVKDGADRPASDLSAKIKIMMPENCPVNLANHMGQANIRELNNRLDVRSEFCKITLFDVAGKIGIDTRFGDLEGEKLDGFVNVNARRSNITLSDIKGHYDITAKYGVIKIYADQTLSSLNIDAEKSHVFLFTPKRDLFEYALTSEFGNILVPDEMGFDFTEQTDNLRKAILQAGQQETGGAVNVTVKVSFGDINIKHKPVNP